MLQKIHERVQGVIAWTLIILIAVTFTLWGINYYLEAHSVSDVQAEVNGEKISKIDYSNTYQRLKHQAEEQTNELSVSQEKSLKERALKQLIFTRVVLQGAESAGYLVTREEAEKALLQIPQFQEDGQFSAEKFQQTLSSALYTPSVFLTKIREGLIINQQRFSFAGTEFVLPEELSQLVGLAKQTRDMRYLIIPEKIFESDVQVSADDLQKYYEKNKAQFKVPEQLSVSYIDVSMKKILSETQVSDKALNNYYQDNLDAYTRGAQWRWNHILIRVPLDAKKSVDKIAYDKALVIEKSLHKGGSFATIAKKNSEDLLSASQGGSMPWVPESGVSSEILGVLKTLKNNSISAPIKTSYGYEIIQRTGYQPEKQIPFLEVKKQITELLKIDKAQEIFADLGDNLTNLSYQNPSSLTEVSKTLGLPIKTTTFFTRKGLSQGIASNKAVIQAAFSDEVLRDGNNSQLLTVGDNLLLVLRLNKYKPSSFQPFDAVKEIIQKQVIKEKASIQASEYGKKVLKELKKDPKNTTVLKDIQKYSLVWKEQKQVQRDNTTLNPSVLSALFKMPPVFLSSESKHQIHFQGITLDDGDYAILELTGVNQGSLESLEKEEHDIFQDEIEATLGIVDYNMYVEGLMHEAKIIEHSK